MWSIILGLFVILLLFYIMRGSEHFDTYGNHLEAAKFLTGPDKLINREIFERPDVFLRYDWHTKNSGGLNVYDKLYEQWTQEKQQADKEYDIKQMVADYGATVSANPVILNTMGQKIRLIQKEF
jgi:hypothetical protein